MRLRAVRPLVAALVLVTLAPVASADAVDCAEAYAGPFLSPPVGPASAMLVWAENQTSRATWYFPATRDCIDSSLGLTRTLDETTTELGQTLAQTLAPVAPLYRPILEAEHEIECMVVHALGMYPPVCDDVA